MQRRYFQIIKTVGRTPVEFVEYFTDYGEWIYSNCIYRWEYVDKQKSIVWLIGSNLVTDYHLAVKELKNRTVENWTHVDLNLASNKKTERQPTMNNKGKK